MRPRSTTTLWILLAALAGCGNGNEPQPVDVSADAPVVNFTPGESDEIAAKPTGPVTISYRVIGKPVVGKQVAIDLRIASKIGPRPISVNYRINDASAMTLAESQPASVAVVQTEVHSAGRCGRRTRIGVLIGDIPN